MENYLTINEKINIIYDFIYNKNSKKCVLNSNINMKNSLGETVEKQIT